MTQKSLKDSSGIADVLVRRTVEILLNLVEELNSKIKGLESENQRLRDESLSQLPKKELVKIIFQ